MKHLFRLAICDDDERFAQAEERIAKECLERTGMDYEILCYSSGEELIGQARQGVLPDIQLLLLDIEMDGVDGIEVKEFFSARTEVKRILFTTSHSEAMPMAFGLRVIGFLVKPFDREALAKRIQIVVRELAADTRITYEDSGEMKSIQLEDIRYIQGEKQYSRLYCTGREPELIRKTLKEWEVLLPEESIIRVHKSYLVNLAHVKRVESTELIMRDAGEVIAIGRSYKDTVRNRYALHQMRIVRGRVWD